MQADFRALVVRKEKPRNFSYKIERLPHSFLTESEILVEVKYTTVNYKDLMSCQGNPAVTRRFPHIPGLDAAGIVIQSGSDRFNVGDQVLVVSSPMGMNHCGGFSEYIRVPEEWLVKLPESMTLRDAMAFGTAGYTAALAVDRLESHLLTGKEVLVTGGSGGVGSISIGILSKLGYRVTALARSKDSIEFLTRAGAKEILLLDDLLSEPNQNLLKPQWHAVIDVAGGEILSRLIRKVHQEGVIVSTGLASDTHFDANVLPFILRGVTLLGINAEGVGEIKKVEVWNKMASQWYPENFEDLGEDIAFDALPDYLMNIEANRKYGRVVVKIGE